MSFCTLWDFGVTGSHPKVICFGDTPLTLRTIFRDDVWEECEMFAHLLGGAVGRMSSKFHWLPLAEAFRDDFDDLMA